MGLIDKLQAKEQCDIGLFGKITNIEAELEIYRLEQRYARRKHRSTFSAGAQYVDGEYVYSNGATSPTSTVSKHSTGSWRPSGWGSQSSR
ncbi:hypothetical protein N7447_005938 [Penicillium robsamsonii]|uniref:uncharacterized protein n=1 Tax=Penicillium robsamsonii TaxID=1792511 RepID=UPI00254764A7|nr:uncharacterized protein N7447_005938 [Penicillium robsamsonii]KAJ5823598.1 hypothetical protein N7447_005938 [Penicillium robsamsonii]